MHRFTRSLLLACAVSLASPALPAEEESEDFEEQDFLFLMEEAYTQEQGQWQLAFAAAYFDHLVEEEIEDEERERQVTDLYAMALEVEYGFSDRLQIELDVPYLRERVKTSDENTTGNGIGDIELALAYALLKERGGAVELTAGLEVSAPTGDEDENLGAGAWGWGAFLALSKRVRQNLYLHTSVGYGLTNDAEEDGEKVDERELAWGTAVVYQPTDSVDLILELVGERSKEKERGGATERTHPIYALAGIMHEWENELQIGLGFPVGLNDDGFNRGAIVRLQYEF